MKTKKSPSLKWANWRPRTASLKACRLKTHEGSSSAQFQSWKRPMLHIEQSGRRSSLLLCLLALSNSSTDWMRLTHNREGCLIQSTDTNINLIKKYHHRHTQKMFDQMSDTIKLTIIIWTEELYSMGSQRVGHNLAIKQQA